MGTSSSRPRARSTPTSSSSSTFQQPYSQLPRVHSFQSTRSRGQPGRGRGQEQPRPLPEQPPKPGRSTAARSSIASADSTALELVPPTPASLSPPVPFTSASTNPIPAPTPVTAPSTAPLALMVDPIISSAPSRLLAVIRDRTMPIAKKLKEIRDLLRRVPESVNMTGPDRWTALTLVCDSGDVHTNVLADVLLKAGAAVNIRNEREETALHYAADNANEELVERLLVEGADPTAANLRNSTPVFNAVRRRSTACLRLCLAFGGNPNTILDGTLVSPLHEAVEMGFLDCAVVLIANGATVEGKDCEGRTPLHIAAKSSKISAANIVKLLVRNSAPLLVQDCDLLTPSELALRYNKSDVWEYLNRISVGCAPPPVGVAASGSGMGGGGGMSPEEPQQDEEDDPDRDVWDSPGSSAAQRSLCYPDQSNQLED